MIIFRWKQEEVSWTRPHPWKTCWGNPSALAQSFELELGGAPQHKHELQPGGAQAQKTAPFSEMPIEPGLDLGNPIHISWQRIIGWIRNWRVFNGAFHVIWVWNTKWNLDLGGALAVWCGDIFWFAALKLKMEAKKALGKSWGLVSHSRPSQAQANLEQQDL